LRKHYLDSTSLAKHALRNIIKNKRTLLSFELEITARCNNTCQHCYINIPDSDKKAKARELSFEEIMEIADEAVSLGALWCLITGGEPLIRDDFPQIYLALKRKGLLVSVFTNATLIDIEHIQLFKKFPPRDIEVTVYGITETTYERVTRKPGSFSNFNRGLNLLTKSDLKVRLKSTILRKNASELDEIRRFCHKHTKDYFRFDPFLHLRYDGDPKRNIEIIAQRLSPIDIVALEHSDHARSNILKRECNKLIVPEFEKINSHYLFRCGAGSNSFTVSNDGFFRLCSSLWHPDCIYDLKRGNLSDAWHKFVLKVREMKSDSTQFLDKCQVCPIINLCLWCPAHAHLETGLMDVPVEYFCNVANARGKAIQGKISL